MTAVATEFTNEPFSFSEIMAPVDNQDEPEAKDVKILATDGVELAMKIYDPPTTTTCQPISLLFYHGGGAYSGGGYQYLARGLSEQFGITVYLADIRGHGESGGARGDAPSKEQVWRDIDGALDFVHKQNPSAKIYLGGHSSGGGLVVNYATEQSESNKKDTVGGYILVSPELGYLSGTARADRKDFARVNILAFILNGIFGVLGHNKAVQFNYPSELLETYKKMVAFNTVNMANAITPEAPKDQMESMNSDNSKPVALWVGSDDELFDAKMVADYVVDTESNVGTVLPGKNHLGILVDIHKQIGPWIMAGQQK